jgi:hypothetical protein
MATAEYRFKSERALRAGGGSAKSETVGMLGFFKKRF